MPRKIENKPINIVREAAEQVVGDDSSPDLPEVTTSLLTDLRTGLALGLLGRSAPIGLEDNATIGAGLRAGEELRGAAQRNPKSQAALWVDMARHGEVSGRFGSREECRPTLIGQPGDDQDWLNEVWNAAFAIGSEQRAQAG